MKLNSATAVTCSQQVVTITLTSTTSTPSNAWPYVRVMLARSQALTGSTMILAFQTVAARVSALSTIFRTGDAMVKESNLISRFRKTFQSLAWLLYQALKPAASWRVRTKRSGTPQTTKTDATRATILVRWKSLPTAKLFLLVLVNRAVQVRFRFGNNPSSYCPKFRHIVHLLSAWGLLTRMISYSQLVGTAPSWSMKWETRTRAVA